MEKIKQALYNIMEINTGYELSNEAAERLLSEMKSAKVCTPIIGKFSSGKSALVNTLLGYSKKLLREDITPETAVPTELIYQESEEYGTIYWNDGREEEINVAEYADLKLDAASVRSVRLHLNNQTLMKIPDVMLVDMPGFESGYEIHNKAIDNYLPQSLAYLITFAADDMIVRESLGNILRELCLHQMPLCIVITKYDKRNVEFEESFAYLRQSLKRYIKDSKVVYCRTSSLTGEVEEVRTFLAEIQQQSQEILAEHFKSSLLLILEHTEEYLNMTVKNMELSESELDEEEERLEKQFQDLDEDYFKERERFEEEIADCTEEIVADVEAALNADESTLIAMALNHQDIKTRINSIVRNTVTESSKRRFQPRVEKYMKRVAKCISGEDIGDIPVSGIFSVNTEGNAGNSGGTIGANMTIPIVAAAAGVLLSSPIILAVAGIMAILGLGKGDGKREDARNQIRMKLQGEVFPQVLGEVEKNVKRAVADWLEQVHTTVTEEVQTKKTTLEKALSDLRARISDEAAQKEKLGTDIKRDLERLGEIRNDL